METQDSNFQVSLLHRSTLFYHRIVLLGKTMFPKSWDKCQDIETTWLPPKKLGSVVLHPRRRGPRSHRESARLSQPCYFLAIHYLFDSFHQKRSGRKPTASALMEVVLVAETELQHLLESSFSVWRFVGEVWPLNSPSKQKKKKKKWNENY